VYDISVYINFICRPLCGVSGSAVQCASQSRNIDRHLDIPPFRVRHELASILIIFPRSTSKALGEDKPTKDCIYSHPA
jgi:hypothetical protein